MNLKKSNEIKKLERLGKVIFLNRLSGKWVKIPKEIAEIFEYADEKNLDLEDLRAMMHDEEDSEYITDIANTLAEINYYRFQKPKERVIDNISYSITHRCNLKCIHCMVEAECGNGEDYFSTEEVMKNLDVIIGAKPNSITITGGEPLVRKDFWEISEYLKKNFNGKIDLMTNATLITEEVAIRLIRLYDSFDISIDGVNEETCALIRGKGVFDKTIKAINYLKNAGAKKISTSMVLTAENSKYTKEYFELNKKLGTKPMLRAMSLYGRAEKNQDVLTKDQTIKQRENFKEEKKTPSLKCCTCTAGYNQAVVEANGDIYPCNLFTDKKYILGNIKNIKDIRSLLGADGIFLSKAVEKFSPDKIDKCKECDLTWFCWSCLQRIERLSPIEFEERCISQKQLLKAVWE